MSEYRLDPNCYVESELNSIEVTSSHPDDSQTTNITLLVMVLIFHALTLIGGATLLYFSNFIHAMYDSMPHTYESLRGEESWGLWTSVLIFEGLAVVYLAFFFVSALMSIYVFAVRRYRFRYLILTIANHLVYISFYAFPVLVIQAWQFFESLR